MTYNSTRTFVFVVMIFSMIVSFSGTLVTSGLREAFLVMIVVGAIVFCTGMAGLRFLWTDKDKNEPPR